MLLAYNIAKIWFSLLFIDCLRFAGMVFYRFASLILFQRIVGLKSRHDAFRCLTEQSFSQQNFCVIRLAWRKFSFVVSVPSGVSKIRHCTEFPLYQIEEFVR